ncbi:hypothetical protein J6590_079071 [Homalodisca vitripennis]|nr:hypothetical protein J6590_079071 [Homalodisca vitripennis]
MSVVLTYPLVSPQTQVAALIIFLSTHVPRKMEPDKSDVIKVTDTFNNYYLGGGAGLASAVTPVTELVVDDGDFAVDSALRLVPLTQADIFRSINELRRAPSRGLTGFPLRLSKGILPN